MIPTRIARAGAPPDRTGPFPSPRPIKPEWFQGLRERRLGRAVGLDQFGVNLLTLGPGAYSSLRHWHEGEDEFVYVLSGELVLIDDNGAHVLRPGDCAGFPAGASNACHLANRSSEPAGFLCIGTRTRGEERIHYPDDPQIGTASVFRGEDGERVQPPG